MRKILNKGFVKLEGTLGNPIKGPFVFQFHIKAPIFVAQTMFLQNFGDIDGAELTEDFYVPAKYGDLSEAQCNTLFTKFENYSKWSFNFYHKLLAEGVIPEQAVMILPMSVYIQFHWTIRASDLDTFAHQSTDMEIDQYRTALLDYYKEKINEK
jgi:thymidylate synthase (FAD)